jgi:hypothetical protein
MTASSRTSMEQQIKEQPQTHNHFNDSQDYTSLSYSTEIRKAIDFLLNYKKRATFISICFAISQFIAFLSLTIKLILDYSECKKSFVGECLYYGTPQKYTMYFVGCVFMLFVICMQIAAIIVAHIVETTEIKEIREGLKKAQYI